MFDIFHRLETKAQFDLLIGKLESHNQHKQPSTEFSDLYFTTYSENVFLSLKLHTYSFLHLSVIVVAIFFLFWCCHLSRVCRKQANDEVMNSATFVF